LGMMGIISADILNDVGEVSDKDDEWFDLQISALRVECEKRGIPKAYVFAKLSVAAQVASIDAIMGIKCPDGREAMAEALTILLDRSGECARQYADSIVKAEIAEEGGEQ
jgi:hypothetical protein